jgi:TRAP-type mannitol/chloroaromatic compound transport system substrate-binding protein
MRRCASATGLHENLEGLSLCAHWRAWIWTLSKYDHVNPSALLRLIANGAQLRAFPQPVLEDCYKAANAIYDGLSKSNPHFKKLYESMLAFRSNSYAWMQVAELGFDNFQMRMRTRT